MTARDLIDRARIDDVYLALGGDPLRHGRGRAFWRNGKSRSVKIDTDRNIWYGFGDRKGGGILDLIMIGLGCDKRAALQWLAEHEGVTLDDSPLSRDERRTWARRRARAERDNLPAERQAVIDDIRTRRNRAWDDERAASRLALRMIREGRDDSPSWDVVWRHVFGDRRGDALDHELQRVQSLTPSAFRLEVTAA